jgi:hypothetical protein
MATSDRKRCSERLPQLGKTASLIGQSIVATGEVKSRAISSRGNQYNRAEKLMKKARPTGKKGRYKMKKFIAACLIVVALIAFTTKPTMAEPITLTVMAITGLIAVASLATSDTAYQAVKDSHKENDSASIQKNDSRVQAQNDSKSVTAVQAKGN